MDETIKGVLAAYEERIARERGAADIPRDERLLAVGPETGAFIKLLSEGEGAKHILELGTSYGYSTIWLAMAARATGGKVTTIDVAPEKQAYARQELAKAGLLDHVEFVTGDAVKLIPTLPDGVDFVLLDIWKDLYVPCLEALRPKLKAGALIVSDNMIRPEYARQEALAYRRAVRALPGVSSVLLAMGSGIELSRVGPAPTDELL